MSALLRLKRLAHLVLEVDFLEGRDDYWLQALQRMSALTHLSMTYYFSEPGAADAPQRSEILHLAQCTQLHRLTGGFTGGSRCYWNWNYESQVSFAHRQPGPWWQLRSQSRAEPQVMPCAWGCIVDFLCNPPVSLQS
jgi:hypothetical protein